MRGRKPTPTNLKLIKGNPGRRPLPENEPQPAPAAPEKPEWLDAEASAEWDRVIPELEALGLLAKLDRALLTSYCQAWAHVVRLERDLEEEGQLVETQGGGVKRHPKAAALREAYERLRSVASEFGMSPVARARVGAAGSKSAEDPLADLERRRRESS